MSRLANLLNIGTLVGEQTYFEYELAVGRAVVVPWLSARMRLVDRHVGDFGCHQGGVLQALRESGAGSGEGFDVDARAVAESPFEQDERFSLHVGDVLDLDPAAHAYDLVLLREVLEHVPERDALLRRCAECLRPGGFLHVSFPPYYAPFGGHQQIASNWPRFAPYLHLLPEQAFFRLVRVADNQYLAAGESLQDMHSVRRTRLTIARAERAFAQAGLRIAARELFILRPEYRVRYGFPVVGAGPVGDVSPLRELLVTGCFYLLAADRRPGPVAGLR